MTQAWYRALSQGFGYVGAALAVVIVVLGIRQYWRDRRLWRRVKKSTPRVGAAATFRVLSAGSRRLPAGEELRVPYEGTMGSAHNCDVCIPYKKVHLRSAFFWMERDGLHMVALHKDGFSVDDAPVEPGDEAILGENAVLRVGELKLVLHLNEAPEKAFESVTGPYVTSARKNRAQQGRGDGLGAPGKGEIRREKKREAKRKQQEKKAEVSQPAKRTVRPPASTRVEPEEPAPKRRRQTSRTVKLRSPVQQKTKGSPQKGGASRR